MNLQNYILKYFLTIGFLIGSSTIYAQSQPLFNQINEADGLSNGRVTSIVKEKNGFVWIGTKNGLNRYDGFQMKVYNKENSNIGSNDISKLFIDSKNRLWVTTLGGGLNLYNPLMDNFTVYKTMLDSEFSLPSNQLNTIFEDSKSNLWIGTESGLVMFNETEKLFTTYAYDEKDSTSISHNSVTSIFEDSEGILWVGTFGGGLNLFSTVDSSFERLRPNENYFTNFIYTISYLDNDNLLVGTSGNGLLMININSFQIIDFFQERLNLAKEIKIVRSLERDSHGDLWIGTDGNGIYHVQELQNLKPSHNNYMHSSQLQSSISGNAIYDIMEDEESNIWIGTAWKGISILDGQSNMEFLYSDIVGKDPFPVLSIYKNQRQLYLGLDGNGLTTYDLKKKELESYNESLQSQLNGTYVQFIKEGKEGTYWLGTFANGLIGYNPQKGSFKKYKYNSSKVGSISYNDVRYILDDDNENLWVATWGGGLNYFNTQNETFEHYRENEAFENTISSDNTISLQQDGENIWIATFGGGLNVLNTKTKIFSHFSYNEENTNSLSSNNLLSLFKDTKNNLWVGTSGEGINRLNLKTLKFDRFEKEAAIRYKTITAITEDNNGKIWFSTKQGIFNFDPIVERFNTFPKLSGDFHINSVFKDDENGELYFGGANGVLRFNPEITSSEIENPRVALIGLKLFNEEVFPGQSDVLDQNIVFEEQITLDHHLDVVTFEFAALLYPFSTNCEYMIKMENFDENWRAIGKEHSATFTNLSAGDYIFKVKSRVEGSEWSDNYTSLRIKILKPFWLQWWAYIIYGLLITGLFYSFRKYTIALERLRANLKLEKLTHVKDTELYNLKQQFFTNMSHEIRTPVTLILGGVNRLIRNGVHLKDNHRNAIEAIKKNSNHLLQLVNELLDYKKLEHHELKVRVVEEDFVKYCEEIYLSFGEMANQKNINFIFRCSLSKIMLWIDKEQFEKVLYNILSNAFKFTENGGDITMELESMENEVLLKISDNGIGMKKNQLDKIFNRFYQVENGASTEINGFGLGLAISKDIVDLHHGSIKAISKRQLGTQFVISLRKGNTHFKADEIIVQNSDSELVESYFDEEKYNKVSKIDFSALEGQSILVVEDNREIRKYIVELLDCKCNVLEAENGEQAFALAVEEIPDLVISDVMMPIMNGISFTRKLKSDMRTSHIPVVLLTARASVMHKMEGFETGADDYVTKPFHEGLLMGRINSILKNRLLLRKKFNSNDLELPEDFNLNRTDKKFLENIISIIKKNIDSDSLNAKFISKELGMSHSVLYKKIKSITGMTFIDFVRNHKLKTAKILIEEHNLTVAEASYHIGYSDKKYFSKLFKQRFGKNPSEFYKNK